MKYFIFTKHVNFHSHFSEWINWISMVEITLFLELFVPNKCRSYLYVLE